MFFFFFVLPSAALCAVCGHWINYPVPVWSAGACLSWAHTPHFRRADNLRAVDSAVDLLLLPLLNDLRVCCCCWFVTLVHLHCCCCCSVSHLILPPPPPLPPLCFVLQMLSCRRFLFQCRCWNLCLLPCCCCRCFFLVTASGQCQCKCCVCQ